MKYNPVFHHRQSIRLKGYDYSQEGAYLITICVHDRQCLFGDIIEGEMHLSRAGKIVADQWAQTASLRSNIHLDAFVIMPNHIHGIVVITESRNGGVCQYAPTMHPNEPSWAKKEYTYSNQMQSPSRTIGALVRGFKSAVTKQVNILFGTPGNKLWQRNYWDRIIRNEKELT